MTLMEPVGDADPWAIDLNRPDGIAGQDENGHWFTWNSTEQHWDSE